MAELPVNTEPQTVLLTGAAGFIGHHLAKALLAGGYRVVGYDSIDPYYDTALKEYRVAQLAQTPGFTFVRANLTDYNALTETIAAHAPDILINLAAQAGVRYSIDNPRAYLESNLIGFFNVLEAARHSRELSGKAISHLLYASSSSVYGNQQKTPFSTTDNVDHPISLYAATKKSNELMAYTYSHLYGIPTTGLRFFTVYGPAGRPDMAYYSFTKKILAGEPIAVFNNGDLRRDFTYVDDIVTGMLNMLKKPPQAQDGQAPAKVYNIGNNQPVQLMHFIHALEAALSKAYGRELTATMEFKPMQAGDVYQTYADVDELIRDFGFHPNTSIEDGLYEFAKWYRDYYGDNG